MKKITWCVIYLIKVNYTSYKYTSYKSKYMDIAKVFATLLPNAVPTLFKFGPSPKSYKRKIITSETAEDANLEIRPNVKSEFNEHGYCYNFPKLTNDNAENTSDNGN